MLDNQQRIRVPERSPTRHFVFAPGTLARRNQPGLYLASLSLFVITAFVLQAVLGLFLGALSERYPGLHAVLEAMARDLAHAPWDWFLSLAALSFATYVMALAFSLRAIHARGLLSVLTDRNAFDWRRLAGGLLLYSALLVGPFLLVLATAKTPMALHFDPKAFWKLVAISAVTLFVQTSAEEAFFRGYLVQFMGSFTNSPLVIIGIPSLLFALAHLGNPELAGDPGIFGFYFGFGVFMSLIAVRDRGLELTIAAHFANNLVTAILVRSPDSVFQTPTLFLAQNPSPADQVPIFAPIMAPILYLLVTTFFMRRRMSP